MAGVTPCLWFDTQGEEAANFYVSLFPNSHVGEVLRWGPDNPEREGQVLTMDFVLDGSPFTVLNGGPQFTHSEAVSFQVYGKDQAEVDRYWDAFIGDGGTESQCGWLTDRFGVSWQVIPEGMGELLGDPDPARARRAMQAMMQMVKLDIGVMRAAADG